MRHFTYLYRNSTYQDKDININGDIAGNVRFADDTLIVTNNESDLQNLINKDKKLRRKLIKKYFFYFYNNETIIQNNLYEFKSSRESIEE